VLIVQSAMGPAGREKRAKPARAPSHEPPDGVSPDRPRTPEIELFRAASENGGITAVFRFRLGESPVGRIIEGSVAMPVDQKVRDSLKLSKLKSRLPRNPRVVDIQVEDYVDSDGEDALRVTVILDEGVEVEKVKADDITALITAIRDRVRHQGVELWPYIWFAKPSELDELEEEDEE
jgi:hypothetical protein